MSFKPLDRTLKISWAFKGLKCIQKDFKEFQSLFYFHCTLASIEKIFSLYLETSKFKSFKESERISVD